MYFPRKRRFWAVALTHFTNDTFMAMGTVLLAFLSATILPMSNTQIGFAVSIKQLISAVTQPGFGLRADRTGGRWIGTGGLAFTVVMFMLAVLMAITTRNYFLMLIPFALQGIGSGAIHPVGAKHAAEVDSERAASNTAYFFLMGQSGLALGPTLIGLMLDSASQGTLLAYRDWIGFPQAVTVNADVSSVFLLGFLAIPVIIFLGLSLPGKRAGKVSEKSGDFGDIVRILRSTPTPFLVIGLLVFLRSLSSPGAVNFIPVLFEQKGWSAAEYGFITTLFWVASGVSGVVMGNLADRFDRRMIVAVSLVASAPAFFLLPVTDGVLALVLAVIAGGFSGGAGTIIVVLAQELIPDSKGFASGAILGFTFGMGALGSLMIGAISDTIGLSLTFQIVAGGLIAAGLVGLMLPSSQPKTSSE